MKTRKWIFRISTSLLSLLMLLSAGMYFFNYEEISGIFEELHYPTYLIYPLAIAKLLGIVTLWTFPRKALQEWAYAGFFFDFVLALTAHLVVQDGEFGGAVVALLLLFISYFNRPATPAQAS